MMRFGDTGLPDHPLLRRAFAFAEHAHRGQMRKAGRNQPAPYITHPVEVARFLHTHCASPSPSLLALALLHDTVEDTPVTLDRIEARFGAELAALVELSTDPPGMDRPDRRARQVAELALAPPEVRLLRIADKAANLGSVMADPPRGWSAERQQGYLDFARAIFQVARGLDADLDAAFEQVAAEAQNIISARARPKTPPGGPRR